MAETDTTPEQPDTIPAHPDTTLVRRLVSRRFPEWGGLSVRAVPSAGTDNLMFRLGDELVVRLPRVAYAAHHVEKEQRWLPRLAPHLPLDVPVPVGRAEADDDFPLPWSVYRWLDGDDAHTVPLTDLAHAAEALGRFGTALRAVDASGGPPSFRGGPVTDWEEGHLPGAVRALAAHGLADADDADLATEAWERVLRLPAWDGPPVWVHGDLLPGNLLGRAGRLTAVIDFGGLGTGDPACDLMPAWTLLTPETRPLFREASRADDASWARGRGWALAWGLVTEAYYRDTNRILASVARRTRVEALKEYAVS
ncbi:MULTISPECIES: aminoglycoside phosphotransferase family protein [unclassified Streptomyces]|uniref:aminoglycoside phosphotransferase family protein n=1 Tax=unclassified Streptomyces TaxID=2593676 RepID=UPI00166077EB|nr:MULTISPECIES: aminoglycoside phosphotransferase family protein [unclassified Streptomyces]MBD0712321.1 phosphotransferase [Streptomyces sp. CBMA291]MBD0716695.1 phosphotransferase [Streptomyces sp. CBMA370]